MRQHTALAHFEDGLPMSKIQYAEVTGHTRAEANKVIHKMIRAGYLTVKDREAREMTTRKYLGERFVITPVGIERLRMDKPRDADEIDGETSVQRAIRTQPTSVWGLA